MTGLVGADTDELRALASDFRSGADELRDLTAQLARGLEAAHEWQGADASRCREEWATFASVQLTGVSEALGTASELLYANAVEQDTASGESTTSRWGWGILDFVADAFPFGKAAWDLKGLVEKGALLATFLKALQMPATGFAALSRFEAVREAMAAFNTKMTGGLGKFLLPVTVYNGIKDAVTGHGYSGWREWGARGFGAIGAGSAAVLIAGAVGVISAPVVLTVAGIGAAAYSAWSLGNAVVDNRHQIGEFFSRLRDRTWAPDGWARTQVERVGGQVGDRVSSALDWARRHLAPAPTTAGAGW
jgi:uncharacterized protein YukE